MRTPDLAKILYSQINSETAILALKGTKEAQEWKLL